MGMCFCTSLLYSRAVAFITYSCCMLKQEYKQTGPLTRLYSEEAECTDRGKLLVQCGIVGHCAFKTVAGCERSFNLCRIPGLVSGSLAVSCRDWGVFSWKEACKRWHHCWWSHTQQRNGNSDWKLEELKKRVFKSSGDLKNKTNRWQT